MTRNTIEYEIVLRCREKEQELMIFNSLVVNAFSDLIIKL
jgi:hypothetical protein